MEWYSHVGSRPRISGSRTLSRVGRTLDPGTRKGIRSRSGTLRRMYDQRRFRVILILDYYCDETILDKLPRGKRYLVLRLERRPVREGRPVSSKKY